MVPIGAIVAAVVLGLRAINAASNNGNESSPGQPTPVSRGSVTFWSDSGAAGTIVFQLILLGMMTGLIVSGLETQSLVLLSFGVASFVFLFPWWVTRKVLVPLGLARLAYLVSWLSRVAWRRDKPGGPALAAAWALVQSDEPWKSSIAWVEQKLAATPRALQGSTVVATGLLEAAKGNHDTARAWLESALMFDPRVAPKHVLRIAAEWLATDAAAAGDWERVKKIAANKHLPFTRTLSLLEAIAGRMQGEPLPTTAGLWFWWLLAPRRLWSWSMVRQAARAQVTRERPHGSDLPAVPKELELGDVGAALFLHRSLRSRFAPGAADVVAVARAWEAALGGALRQKLFERATLIGGGDPDAAISEVRALVEKELAPLVPQNLTGVGGELPLLVTHAVSARRDELMESLEERIDRMDRRKLERRELPVVEEWRELLALRATYTEICATGGLAERSLAHSIIKDKLVNFGVWLFNERLERPMANAIFRFLETEAVSVGDVEAERLNSKNAACGL